MSPRASFANCLFADSTSYSRNMVRRGLNPGIYAALPPGWYYFTMKYHYDNVPHAVEEIQLAVRPSEIDTNVHRDLCQYWSEHLNNWNSLTKWFINWDDKHAPPPTVEQAANCLLLLDHQIRRIFGGEVFSQREFKPWGGQNVVNIDQQDEYYSENNMVNPYEYRHWVKLPEFFDTSRIDYFCAIYNVK